MNKLDLDRLNQQSEETDRYDSAPKEMNTNDLLKQILAFKEKMGYS